VYRPAVTPTATIMELTARPAAARAYEALLTHSPHLALADVARDVARRTAQLRAR